MIIGATYRAERLIGNNIDGKRVTHIGGYGPDCERVDFYDGTAKWMSFAEMDNAIALLPPKTFVHRHGKGWIASVIFEGKVMEVCPMIGKPYLAQKSKSFFALTRLKVERELEAYLDTL